MHHDDELVGRRVRRMLRTNSSWARRAAPRICLRCRLGRIGPEIIDIVEHQEQRLGVEERVIVRPEHALESFAAVAAVGRLEIQVVVAADVPPGQADRADDRIVAAVERKVVEHHVAGGEAEFRRRSGQRLDHVLADEIDFRLRFGLRIGEQHHLEFLRLVLTAQRKIERGGQRRRSARRLRRRGPARPASHSG